MLNWAKIWNCNLGMADPINRAFFWATVFMLALFSALIVAVKLFVHFS